MPVIAEISASYSDQVTFVGVAGRSDIEPTTEVANDLIGNAFAWGLGDDVWTLYDIRSQPVTVLLAGNDVIVDQWVGMLDASEIASRIDNLIAVSS